LSDEELMIGMDLEDNFLVEGDETGKMSLVLLWFWFHTFYRKRLASFF